MVTDKVPYPVQLQGVRTVRNVERLRCPVANGTGGGRLYLSPPVRAVYTLFGVVPVAGEL